MKLPILLIFLCYSVNSLNIFIYSPRYGHSHTSFMGKIADLLAAAGHRVVILQPILIEQLKENGTKLAEVIEIPPSERVRSMMQAAAGSASGRDRWTMSGTDPRPTIKFLQLLREAAFDAMKRVVEDEEIMSKLRAYRFDIGFSEAIELSAYGLFHELALKKYITVLSSTIGASFASIFGAPMAPSYVPSMSSSSLDRMNLAERFGNLFGSLAEKYMITSAYTILDEFFTDLDPKFPGIEEQLTASSLVLANVEPLFDYPRPLIHKLQYIGGVTVPERGALDEKWSQVLSERPQTILISFGSMARSVDMPTDYKTSLLHVFSRFPNVTFIWKYEENELDGSESLPNLHLHPWVPQTDLLGDPRLTGFVTHGGAGSINELVYHGKKALVIPLFADQFANAKLVSRVGSTLELSKFDLADSDKLEEAIGRLLNDQKLTENALKMAKMISEKPFKAQEILLKNTEFVAKYGPLTQLDPKGRQLSYIEYFLIDIVLFAFSCLIIFIVFIYFVIRKLCGRSQKPKQA